MERKPLTRRERIEKYYDELIAQGSAGFPPEIMAYLSIFISLCFSIVPAQEFVAGEQSWGSIYCFVGPHTVWIIYYMRKYLIVTYERNRTEIVGEKLRYMPIGRKENRRYLFGKLIAFLKKPTIAGLIMQLGVTLITYHSISIWNIIYVLVVTFIIPFVLCGLTIVQRDISAWR